MSRASVFYGVLCVNLLIGVAQAPAQQLLSQQMLSTAEWVELSNTDLKAATFYLKGVMETLGNTGNFTCRTPISLAQTAIRIQLDVHDNPDKVHRWFIPALMADLTRWTGQRTRQSLRGSRRPRPPLPGLRQQHRLLELRDEQSAANEARRLKG